MRRCFAGALLLIFLAQLSGVSLAASPRSGAAGASLGTVMAALRSALMSSLQIATFAPLGRHGSHVNIDPAGVMRSRQVLKPQRRHGTPEHLKLPSREALTSRTRPPDPRAMRRSTIQKSDEAKTAIGPAAGPAFERLKPLSGTSTSLNEANRGRSGGVKKAISSNQGTGIEHWWTYEEQAIPGIGKALLNVGTGNLIVSAMDINVPEQGINLAFQRVYNSQSLHDVNGDDGGDPAIFGNGWTNNFDANIVYNGNVSPSTITVYDLDGTACTYTATLNGAWTPCTGEHATLAPVQGNGCTYTWTKPNGTVYVFQNDGGSIGFCTGQNLVGHLVEILGRNTNNYVTFTYSWDSSGIKTSEHITEIDANHSDGDKLVMAFGLVHGYNELDTITRPDQAVLQYWYDQNGNLVEVDKPGNNSAWHLPNNPHSTWQTGDLPETYAYVSGTDQMNEACGPRCTAAMWANATNPQDGASLVFGYTGSQLSQWELVGVVNFTPDDQTNTPLQNSQPGWEYLNLSNFQYGSSGPCPSVPSNATAVCDWDGHLTIWTTDSSARVTSTQRCTANCKQTPHLITTGQTWDSSNNLISTTDANGYITQYGYDASGNMVETQLPSATDFSGPQNQTPLSFYSYDQYNNVLAYCDPVWTRQQGSLWQGNPGDSLCPSTTGTTHFTYNTSDPNEPYGCLTDMYKPSGYHTKMTYVGATCGVGLPRVVQAAQSISQFNNSTRLPTQDFNYDAYGNLTSYDRGSDGTHTLDSWTLSYNPGSNKDNLNYERTQNEPLISGAAINSFTCYYPDGSVFYTETPSQHGADNSSCPTTASLLAGPQTPPTQATAHYYDYDGDEVKTISYKGCLSSPCATTPTTICSSSESQNPLGTTCKYYDGLDRLVETAQPWDKRKFADSQTYEFYTFRWMNRYIYDISFQGGAANLTVSDRTGSSASFSAFGNLYKTQEYLPQVSHMQGCYFSSKKNCPTPGPYSSASWSDVRGTSYDPLDRPVSKYELAFGTNAVTTNTYDGSGQAGQLSAVVNAVGQQASYTYDPIGRLQQESFTGDPRADTRSYTFDSDGRIASVTAGAPNNFGTISYTYDVDGNELTVTEPTKAQGYDGGSFICYEYYPDGMREYLTIGSAGGNYSNCSDVPNQSIPGNDGISQNRIFSYAYTQDGRLSEQDVNWANNPLGAQKFSWTYMPSGREQAQYDNLTPPPGHGQDLIAYNPTGHGTTLTAKSYSYSKYGRINGLTLPGGFTQANLTYDQEDELAGYTACGGPSCGAGGVQHTMTLNARGEILADATSGGDPFFTGAQGETYSANGTQVGAGDYHNAGGPYQRPPTTLQYDLRSGMVECSTDPNYAQDYSNGTQFVNPYVYSYDTAGRQTGSGYDTTGTCDPSNASGSSTYDEENHIRTSSIYQASGNATWGSDGRQRITLSGGHQGDPPSGTAHWDGDSLLFATGGTNTPQLYIGKVGVMDATGNIDIYDRDQSGAKVSSHGIAASPPFYMTNGVWYDGWSSGSIRTVTTYKNGQQYVIQGFTGSCNAYFTVGNQNQYYPCPTESATFEMARADGYKMVGGIVQGARTYDTTSGQWLSPDAYAGNVNDPMSQKPFIWNNNNPDAYVDPSGYDAVFQGLDGAGAQPLTVDSSLTGETAAYYASNYFTSMDIKHILESAYATTVMALHRNLDPQDYSDLSFLANNVRSSLKQSAAGNWSLTNNFVTATLSGISRDVAFAIKTFVGEVHIDVEQGDKPNRAGEEFLRYTHFPGMDEIIQARYPAGLNVWQNSDISPDENIKWPD